MPPTESSPVANDNPRRFGWRRLLQFQLRTLLILTTVVAIWLGWWSYNARQQRKVVVAILGAGGHVAYDFQFRELQGPPHWPKWLVYTIGEDYFANVKMVVLVNHSADHRPGLGHFQGGAALSERNLWNVKFTDAEVPQLKALTQLETLFLYGTEVTDAGLEHLKDLTSLEELNLGNTQVTDSGIIELVEMKALQRLDLHNTKVTDAGVERLQQALPNCQIHR